MLACHISPPYGIGHMGRGGGAECLAYPLCEAIETQIKRAFRHLPVCRQLADHSPFFAALPFGHWLTQCCDLVVSVDILTNVVTHNYRQLCYTLWPEDLAWILPLG